VGDCEERPKSDPKHTGSSHFPCCEACALVLEIAVLSFGTWYVMFSDGPGGRITFFLAYAAMPIGVILCWYGIDRLLVWSVNGQPLRRCPTKNKGGR
jgi:hypothetical protein